MYYNRKFSLNLRTYACFSLSSYGGRHLEKRKTLKDASLASFRFRFLFYATFTTKINNNLLWGYFCKIKEEMLTWQLDYKKWSI